MGFLFGLYGDVKYSSQILKSDQKKYITAKHMSEGMKRIGV